MNSLTISANLFAENCICNWAAIGMTPILTGQSAIVHTKRGLTQRVEVIILAENNERAVLAQKLRELLKETQTLHVDNPLTEEEIAAEIEAYHRGE